MNDKNHKIARILVLIPIAVFVVTALCMGLALLLEGPTNRGVVYGLFILIGLFGVFLMPLPCFVMAVLGTIFALKAAREGIKEARKYAVMGFIEILACIPGIFIAFNLFEISMGV